MGDAELTGDVGDGDFAVSQQLRLRNASVVTQRCHGVVVEDPAGTSEIAGVIEHLGKVSVGQIGVTTGQVDRCWIGATVLGDPQTSGGDDLVCGAGVPQDPDASLCQVGLGQQGDIRDEGAQEPFAVSWRGGGRVPQRGHVAGEGFELGASGQFRSGSHLDGKSLLSLGEGL